MSNLKIVQDIISSEKKRQDHTLELIPSENYVSNDVRQASGSVFTNKYAEGYPGRRYYGGQENTDKIEQLAIDVAKNLFNSDHANVQPHSGAQANEAVYHAWCDPGDTILAMSLSHGGHLTHGHPATVLSRIFNFVHYGVSDTKNGDIDIDEVRGLALKYKPKIILVGFSSYTRNLDYKKFAEIGKEMGAMLMADVSHIAGLIAGGVLDNPLDFGFHVLTTTTHKTLRGPRGGMILSMGELGDSLKKPDKKLENLPTLIDRAVFPGIQGGPHMHTIAAKAVALQEASGPDFKQYTNQILKNSKKLEEELRNLGFKFVFGGTDNHMLLIDIVSSFKSNKNMDGKIAQEMLEAVGITSNKNSIPDDPRSAFSPSGLRIGTPAITTAGAKEKDMRSVASLINRALNVDSNDLKQVESIRLDVIKLRESFTK